MVQYSFKNLRFNQSTSSSFKRMNTRGSAATFSPLYCSQAEQLTDFAQPTRIQSHLILRWHLLNAMRAGTLLICLICSHSDKRSCCQDRKWSKKSQGQVEQNEQNEQSEQAEQAEPVEPVEQWNSEGDEAWAEMAK